MKTLMQWAFGMFLLLASATLSAQTSKTQSTATETAKTQSVDRGSAGAITMEEYQTLSEQFQKANPGKTFQDLSKEEFETYLTTELAKLRQKKAEEATKTDSPK